MAETGINLSHPNDQLMALERTIRELSQPQDIMEHVCRVLTAWFEFVGFLHVKGTKAIGWVYQGQSDLPSLPFETINLDLALVPALAKAIENQVMVQLEPITLPDWQPVWQARGVEPKPSIVLPVRIGPRVPFILYADFSKRPDAVVIGLINQTIGVLGMRLEQIILEKRLQKAQQNQTTPAEPITEPVRYVTENREQSSEPAAHEAPQAPSIAPVHEDPAQTEAAQTPQPLMAPSGEASNEEPASIEEEGEFTPDMLNIGDVEDPFASTSPTQPGLETIDSQEPEPATAAVRWVDQLKNAKGKTRATISAPSLLPASRKQTDGSSPTGTDLEAVEPAKAPSPTDAPQPKSTPRAEPASSEKPDPRVTNAAAKVKPGMTPPPELALRGTLSLEIPTPPPVPESPDATQVISVLRNQTPEEDKPLFQGARRERKTFSEMRAAVAEDVKQGKYDQPKESSQVEAFVPETPPPPPSDPTPRAKDQGIQLVSAQDTQAEQGRQYKRKTFVEMAIFDPEIKFDPEEMNRTSVPPTPSSFRASSRSTLSAVRSGNEPPPPPSPFDELIESTEDYLGEEVRKRTETLILSIPQDHPIPVGRFPEPYTLPDGHIVVNLLHMGDHGRKKLIQMLQQSDPRHRYLGVLAFVYRYDPTALEFLAPLLFDRELHIAEMTLRLLKYYRNTKEFHVVAEEVLTHLEDENDALLDDAIGFAGELRLLPALEQLINLMNNKALVRACVESLQKTTFQPIGDNQGKWRRWLEKNERTPEYEWALRALTGKETDLAQSALREMETMSGKRLGHFDLTQRRGRQQAYDAWKTYWETEAL